MPKKPDTRARRIVDTYADMLLRVCTSHLGSRSEAEDITQETLLALHESTTLFNSPEHEKAWVLRVAINRCKDFLKSAAHRTRADESLLPETPRGPDLGPVSDAVLELPEDQRIAVHLYYYEGYSAAEIAELTETTRDTTYQRLHRARTSLATILKGVQHA